MPGDTNGQTDLFVRDLRTGGIERVSLGTDGAQADSWSTEPAISADGRYVAFTSAADNLVPGDANGAADIFVRDRRTGRTERITPDGRGTDTGPRAARDARAPAISADGNVVAFASARADLVPGDTNGVQDVFAYDRRTHATRRASVASGGAQANAASTAPFVSADGRHVAFASRATNLDAGAPPPAATAPKAAEPRPYPSYVHDLRTGRTRAADVAWDGARRVGRVAAAPGGDGRRAVFESGGEAMVRRSAGEAMGLFLRDFVPDGADAPPDAVGAWHGVGHKPRFPLPQQTY